MAAIETVMISQTSGLESKVALLIESLEGGFSDGDKAIDNLQKALDSSLKGLDAKLSTLKADILGKLDAISGQITEKELAKAFQGILDAIDKQDKSTEEVLQSVLDVLKTVEESLGHVLPTHSAEGAPPGHLYCPIRIQGYFPAFVTRVLLESCLFF